MILRAQIRHLIIGMCGVFVLLLFCFYIVHQVPFGESHLVDMKPSLSHRDPLGSEGSARLILRSRPF